MLCQVVQEVYTALPNTIKNECILPTAHEKPTETQWYTNTPLGHNTLSKTVARVCKSAGIIGFKTIHSLQVTAATRLYQSGVEEQLIMEKTGHGSLEGVRSYKRISDEQRESLSCLCHSAIHCPSVYHC